MSNVLSQAEDKLGLIDEAGRILKPGGLALVIDMTGEHLQGHHTKHHIVVQDKAVELFAKRGWKKVKSVSTDPHHYGIILKHE